MSSRNLIFRQQASEDSSNSNQVASSPSLSSLQRFNIFRSENFSSQLGQLGAVATGAVTGTSMTEHAQDASTDGTPKRRKPG